MNFSLKRTIDITAFVADDDPNATPPPAGEIINVAAPAQGQGLYLAAWDDDGKALVIPAASFDFVGWWLDQGSGLWVRMSQETDAPAFQSFKIGLADQMWIQILAIDDASGTSEYAELWAGARDVI